MNKNKVVPCSGLRDFQGHVESKYKHVWQSARLKLRFRLVVNGILSAAVHGDNEENVNILRMPGQESGFNDTFQIERVGKYLIRPESAYLGYWNLFIGLTIVYCALIMPYFLAFGPDDNSNPIEIFDRILTGVYFFDFIINCNVARIRPNGTYMISRFEIIIDYLKSWMIVDIIAFFPFELLVSDDQKYNHLSKLARIPRLYKIFKISKIVKWFKFSKNTTLLMKLQDIFSIRHAIIQMAVTFSTISICIHIAACLWCFIAKVEINSPDSWMFRHQLLDADEFTQYLTGLYWSFTTFSSVGYGDIFAGTNIERIFSIFWMLVSLQFLGFTIATLSGFLGGLETRDSLLLHKLAIIDEFSTESGLKKCLRLKLRNALRVSSTISGFTFNEKHNLLFELPRTLRFEVALAMHRGAAKVLDFFHNKEDTAIFSIIPFLVPMFVNSGNFVYEIGDIPDEFYFIMKGRVLYMNPLDFHGIYTINKKDYFGDIEVMMRKLRMYSAMCKSNVELLVFNMVLLNRIKKDYPVIWVELDTVARARCKIMEQNVKRVLMLRKCTQTHTKSQLHIIQFKTYNIIRREMKKSQNVKSLKKSKKASELTIEEKFSQVNQKIEELRKKISDIKSNKNSSNSPL